MQLLIDLWAANGTFPSESSAYEYANAKSGAYDAHSPEMIDVFLRLNHHADSCLDCSAAAVLQEVGEKSVGPRPCDWPWR